MRFIFNTTLYALVIVLCVFFLEWVIGTNFATGTPFGADLVAWVAVAIAVLISTLKAIAVKTPKNYELM